MSPPTGTTTRPSPRARPRRIDPRIEARRVEVARSAGRRRLRLLLALLLASALVVDGWLALHSSWFAVRHVTVLGAGHSTAPAVVAAAGLANEPPLVDVDPGAAAAAIERLPWVASATVVRHWPDAVSITVTERVPVGLIAEGHDLAEVDATGRVLAVVARPVPGLVELAAPVHAGPAGSDLGAGAAPALVVAASLPPAFKAQVAGITVVPGGRVVLTMTTPLKVVLGTTAELRAKYEDVAAILAGASLHTGDVIDVSVPQSPTVTSA
ncbi:MAG TPA: FtsQ-type POTRA domain-containing protein [Acidimicrobiales bacterium]|nr:FtsQ-type POTRA domain-containing protein [Acidimicrobiales bacterium]